MLTQKRLLLSVCLALLASGYTPAHAQMAVYATDGLARVRPTDAPAVAAPVAISAARNEYEPFQVIVHAGRAPLSGVNAVASALRSASGAVIDASHITLYREQYVHVVTASPQSRGGAGWYPDALIPFTTTPAPLINIKQRFAGAPFVVTANSNQPVWIDVFVPRDAAPGDYTGTLTVSAEKETPVQIAVKLTVWNFTLPDTPSLRSSFGKLGTDVAKAHGVPMNSVPFRTPEWNYAVALAAHRISPLIPNTDYPRVNPDGSIDVTRTDVALKKWISTFHVTGFPIRLLGDDPAGRDRARNVTHLRAMYAYLKSNGWEKMAYVYVFDEPNSAADYEQVRQRAKLVHDAQPGIKVLCTEQPVPDKPEWGSLVGSVDIWAPQWTLWDDASIAQRESAGDEIWSYTSLCMQTPAKKQTPYWQIDFPLLDYRIPAWISWRYGATGLLYWSPVNWGQTPDVWTNPATYHTQGAIYNGDGSLLYPGSAINYNGPVVSMRLQEIREGFEDYEYLKLLADRGDKAFADQVVQQIARSWTDWDARPQALYDARAAIAQKLTAGQ
jgi:hypothetical protein